MDKNRSLQVRIAYGLENASSTTWHKISFEQAMPKAKEICEAVEYASLAAAKRYMATNRIRCEV